MWLAFAFLFCSQGAFFSLLWVEDVAWFGLLVHRSRCLEEFLNLRSSNSSLFSVTPAAPCRSSFSYPVVVDLLLLPKSSQASCFCSLNELVVFCLNVSDPSMCVNTKSGEIVETPWLRRQYNVFSFFLQNTCCLRVFMTVHLFFCTSMDLFESIVQVSWLLKIDGVLKLKFSETGVVCNNCFASAIIVRCSNLLAVLKFPF